MCILEKRTFHHTCYFFFKKCRYGYIYSMGTSQWFCFCVCSTFGECVSSLCHLKHEKKKRKVKPWSHDWFIAAGAYPSFCSMKRLGVFLRTSPGGDASPLQVTTPQFVRFPPTIRLYPFIHSGGERDCES